MKQSIHNNYTSKTIEHTSNYYMFNFAKFYSFLPQHITKEMLSEAYLTWFIGFFEADGTFEQDGRVNITQKYLDKKLLYNISTTLGMGTVYDHNKGHVSTECGRLEDLSAQLVAQPSTESSVNAMPWPLKGPCSTACSAARGVMGKTARWRTKASNADVAARIALLFNGNIVTSSKLNNFKRWCENWLNNEEFRRTVGPDFEIQSQSKPKLMSFSNGWLSGFIDGDGHWGISVWKTPSRTNPGASIKMAVIAQGDPEWIEKAQVVLNMGRRDPRTGNKNVKWTVSKHTDLDILVEYIEKYPHKTLKGVSFSKFCKLRRRILKKEHHGAGYEEIKALCLEVNKFY
jgi:hypothetical protein